VDAPEALGNGVVDLAGQALALRDLSGGALPLGERRARSPQFVDQILATFGLGEQDAEPQPEQGGDHGAEQRPEHGRPGGRPGGEADADVRGRDRDDAGDRPRQGQLGEGEEEQAQRHICGVGTHEVEGQPQHREHREPEHARRAGGPAHDPGDVHDEKGRHEQGDRHGVGL